MSRDSTLQQFGLVIAYLLPGIVLLQGSAYLGLLEIIPVTVRLESNLSLGGFLSSTLAALGLGMTISAVRWLLIDTIHHRTGLQAPQWNFTRLTERVAAFDLIVEHYYRYYQFYANTLVSFLILWVVYRIQQGLALWSFLDLLFLLLIGIFFSASRDSLKRYYDRGGQLMASPQSPTKKRLT